MAMSIDISTFWLRHLTIGCPSTLKPSDSLNASTSSCLCSPSHLSPSCKYVDSSHISLIWLVRQWIYTADHLNGLTRLWYVDRCPMSPPPQLWSMDLCHQRPPPKTEAHFAWTLLSQFWHPLVPLLYICHHLLILWQIHHSDALARHWGIRGYELCPC